MSDQKASASYQCVYIQDAGTFTIALMGAEGDIVQMYRGSALNPDAVIPSWSALDEASRPVLKVILMSSDTSHTDQMLSDMVNNAATVWYVNDEALTFTNAGLSTGGSYNGLFKKIGAGEDAKYPFGGLRVNGDVVTASGGVPMVIRCELAIEAANSIAKAQASYPLRVLPMLSSTSVAEIYCAAGQSFALDADNTYVDARVRLWSESGETDASKYTVKWYIMQKGEWVYKTDSAVFRVTRDEVDTFGQIRAECWSKDTTPALIASDMQTLSDSSDPFVIYPNPTPADGRLWQTGGPDEVSFEPKLKRISGEEVTGVKFLFAVLDPMGTIWNQGSQDDMPSNKVECTTFAVPKSVFVGMQAGPTVNITAVA